MDATLDNDFNTTTYALRVYTAGMYYFDAGNEVWGALGISVTNTTNLMTAAQTSHLTSFATGYFPVPNKIDFEFVFATASFADNLTIFMLLIISFLFYIIAMIYALVKDIKDDKAVSQAIFSRCQLFSAVSFF